MLHFYLPLIGLCELYLFMGMSCEQNLKSEIITWNFWSNRDRIRTTNNMLGDCYASAVVEELSKRELMALDAAYQGGTPVTSTHRHILANGQTDIINDAVIVEMNNSVV